MRRTSLHRLLPLACLLALHARAGELLSGRLYTVPEKVFVNQAFEIHFELEVTSGSEVQDLRISDFPNNPELLTAGQLQTTSRAPLTRDGKSLDVLHFTAAARGHKPISHTFQPRLQCVLVQRRARGFFSSWQNETKQLHLAPFTLRILPLPEAGRPAHFSGAVGVFKLTGRLSRETVQPGDIITLSLALSGQGWLADATITAPPASPLFKTYPAKVRLREPLRLETDQVFIPQTTNATAIAAACFSFFNPVSEAYEESVAGPFPLTFQTAPVTPAASQVRVISTSESGAPVTAATTVTIERVNQSLRRAVPLLVVFASAFVAVFVFFQLCGRHLRLALFAGASLLAGGGGVGYLLKGRAALSHQTVSQRTEALFAPSSSSATLFTLKAGTPVTPLETAGDWVRVDVAGRRGWIPVRAVKASGVQRADPPEMNGR